MTTIMTTTRSLGLAAALALAVGLPGCQETGAFEQIRLKLDQIDTDQRTVLSRLDQLETKIANLPAGGPAPRGAQKKGPQPNKPAPKATYKVAVGDAHVKGSPEALVTIVEWSDFQCPYCSRVTPTIDQLTKEYGDTLRVAFKHNPLGFHPRAKPAALAAEAAGRQGKFWEMHDKLFANQKQLTDDNFVAWAGELGLDVKTFEKDMADPALAKKLTQHQSQGMSVGARGTPAFFVNGRFLSGAQPAANFKALIDEEMKKAETLVAKGTPKAKVYEAVIARGKTKV